MQILCGLYKKTGEIIYSRAHYDCVYTSDKLACIDNGQSGYAIHASGELEIIRIELDVTTADLYNDWNYWHDKYDYSHE